MSYYQLWNRFKKAKENALKNNFSQNPATIAHTTRIPAKGALKGKPGQEQSSRDDPHGAFTLTQTRRIEFLWMI